MALLFCDSFDHYDSSLITQKWTSITSTPTIGAYGRNSTNGLRIGGSGVSVKKVLASNYATLIVGFAFMRASGFSATMLVALQDGTSNQIEVRHDASGHITITRNGTVLATSGNAIVQDVYFHLQVKATIADSGGTVEVYINNASWVSFTGDTKNTSNAYVNGVNLNNTSNNAFIQYDDFWILNTSGSYNTDFLGDVRIECLIPTGAGNSSDFTPSTGSNYQNVDDASPDDDTTYNASATATDKDDFEFENLLTSAGDVFAVQRGYVARKDDAGTRTMRPVYYASSTYYNGSNTNVPDNYLLILDILEENPDTTAAWAISEVNAAQFGYELVA